MTHDRDWLCRRCARGDGSGHGPFVLGGARPYYVPDRVCDVHHLAIAVRLDFERETVEGTCTQTLSPISDGPTRLVLDAVEMTIEAVSVAGSDVAYEHDGRSLRVDLGERRAGEKIEAAIRYRCQPRRGLYFIKPDRFYPDRPLQAWTQGQDEDNRFWFPCFDHPNEKSTSEVIATVPAQMMVLSNGRLIGVSDGDGVRTFRFRQEVAHASYLVTLVAGEFAEERSFASGVELRTYVPPARAADAERSFSRTGEMIALFNQRIGVAYPYPTYSQIAVAEFIFGGMENTSATTLTDLTLHDARAHLDYSSEPLVAHELAHQWFGDLVTCRDWSEGWLNEGFATYFELLWREHMGGEDGGEDAADFYRLLDAEAYFAEDGERYRRPIVANVFHAPIDVFDRHLYEKGACVLHMIRHRLGDARFFRALKLYVERHRGDSVETRDLARAIDAATGVNLDRFFDQWVFGAGYPELEVEYGWDDETKLARVHVKQKQKAEGGTPIFTLPLTVRFVFSDGGTEVERDVLLEVDAADQAFLVALPAKPTQAVIDPRSHLLKKLDGKKPEAMWRAELASARHGIDRLLAARALGKAGEPTAIPSLAAALSGDRFWAARGEAAAALAAIRTEAARDAILAAVATEPHPRARRMIVRALGAFRGDETVAAALTALLERGDASYFVEAEAASSLAKTRHPAAFETLQKVMVRPSHNEAIRSACLGGMAELRDERGVAVAREEAARGKPQSSRHAAISALAKLAGEHRAHLTAAVETLTELLDDPDFRARVASVDALHQLADRRALGPLARVEGKDLDGRVRRAAREAMRAIGEGLSDREKVGELREQLEKLRKEGDEMRERLLKLETKRA